MQRYIARRVLSLFVVLAIMSVVIFLILRVFPGDIVDVLKGEDGASLSVQQERALRARLGLDAPLHEQYFSWISDIFTRGDFGSSIYSGEALNKTFKERLPVTILLAIYSTGFMVLIGLPLGIMSALRANTIVDHGARFIAILGLSVPNFWLRIFRTISSVGITRFWSRWPHRFGDSWSSICRAAIPACSYARTVRWMFSTPPYPVSASAITGMFTVLAILVALRTISLIVARPRSG